MKFSVLMSIYIKEKTEYVRACFNSLLNQTVKADEWLIVEDGPLTSEMYVLIDEYEKLHPGLIRRIPLKQNQGLGRALRVGITYCNNELVARMDTDDIARQDRFEKQINEFKRNPKLDICGSHIIEFEGTIENEIARRNVPLEHSEIAKYQKQRSAFNHMTVMYKKSTVINAGNYEHCPLMEDDMLWIRMLIAGATCKNIDDYLVYARTGQEMIKRRGGWSYFKKYRSGRRKILDTGYIGKWDYLRTIEIQFFVALTPPNIRLYIFTKLLRRG